jgi:hypothetical protein
MRAVESSIIKPKRILKDYYLIYRWYLMISLFLQLSRYLPNFSILNLLRFDRRVCTPRSDLRSILEQYPRDRQQCHRNEPQQTRCPSYSQIRIHLNSEQRKYTSKCISQQPIRSHRTRTIESLVSIDDVRSTSYDFHSLANIQLNSRE